MSSYKLKLASLAGRIGLASAFDLLYQRPRILFYHGVTETIEDKRVQGNQMLFSVFKKQIFYLKKKYKIISLDDFYDRLMDKSLKGDEIVITFDDGYKNNYTIVAPFLKSLEIPFTVFVCPELIDEKKRVPTYYVRTSIYCDAVKTLDIPSLDKRFELTDDTTRYNLEQILIKHIKQTSNENVHRILDDIKNSIGEELLSLQEAKYKSEELMDWNEVREIIKYGATIGSHCLDHAILHGNQSEQETIRQLRISQEMISRELGSCDYFAFPNGDSSSVCPYSLNTVNQFYKLGFAANGKSLRKGDTWSYISRVSICNNYHAFKSQMSILANIH